MDTAQTIGLMGVVGAIIGGYANLPQIHHLIKEKCSAGISLRAYRIWLFSSVLLLVNAVYIHSLVFTILSLLQFVSSVIILIFGSRNQAHICESHLLGKI